MKKLMILALLFLTYQSHSQIKALTEEGKEAVLYPNGTWKYLKENEINKASDNIIPTVRNKSKEATFKIKGERINYTIWFNPNKWSIKKLKEGAKEYSFSLKGEDALAMVIPEGIEIPLASLRKVALENAQKASPDMAITKEETRTVNGKEMMFLQFEGNINGSNLFWVLLFK